MIILFCKCLCKKKPLLNVYCTDFLFLYYRLVTNKLLLGVIILMELAILGAVIYLKFFRG